MAYKYKKILKTSELEVKDRNIEKREMRRWNKKKLKKIMKSRKCKNWQKRGGKKEQKSLNI